MAPEGDGASVTQLYPERVNAANPRLTPDPLSELAVAALLLLIVAGVELAREVWGGGER